MKKLAILFTTFCLIASCGKSNADDTKPGNPKPIDSKPDPKPVIAIKIIGCSGGILSVQMDNNSESSIYISPGMNINSPLFGGTNGLICNALSIGGRRIWGVDPTRNGMNFTDKFDELQVSDPSVFAYTLKPHQHSIFTFYEDTFFKAGQIIQCAAYPTVIGTNQVLNVVSAPFTCGQ